MNMIVLFIFRECVSLIIQLQLRILYPSTRTTDNRPSIQCIIYIFLKCIIAKDNTFKIPFFVWYDNVSNNTAIINTSYFHAVIVLHCKGLYRFTVDLSKPFPFYLHVAPPLFLNIIDKRMNLIIILNSYATSLLEYYCYKIRFILKNGRSINPTPTECRSLFFYISL